MMSYFIFLFLGILFAALGGELFVRGTIGIARLSRVSPGIIAVTISAFATSSPELSVCITSSFQGIPQITMGDSMGSNVANVALILGLALCISKLQCPLSSIRRDFSFAVLTPILLGILVWDGLLSRLDCLLLLGCFLIWFHLTIQEARIQRKSPGINTSSLSKIQTILFSSAGLALLILAGNSIVYGARNLAVHFGVSAFYVGSTLVAVGTSVPELATTIVAKIRGYDDVSLGTILGSNIFNGLFIVSTAGAIHPVDLRSIDVRSVLLFGLVAVLAALPRKDGIIPRSRGFFLLGIYLLYLSNIIF